MSGSKRIIFNTGITYLRAIITSLISFYVTRVVLENLGASDFGLYNVIAGMIALLSFLNAAMTTSTQRFISFNLGKSNIELVKKIYANSVWIHLVIGILVIIGIETIGMYLITYTLDIAYNRIEIAKILLHFVTASTFFTIISVPYDAVLNAHENMSFLAFSSLIESCLKLCIALSLSYLVGDKLYYYGLLMMVSTLIVTFLKRYYVHKKYSEVQVSIFKWFDSSSIKELTSFAGWSLFGTLCYLGRNQGIAILLNIFYVTVINAAYAIANQINAQMMFFSQTMMASLRPQIMKSEGANDRQRMIRLSLSANKLCFFLFTFFTLPLYFQLPFILNLWLTNVPEYTVEFCRAVLLLTMANQINMGIMTAVQAIGNIKMYQFILGITQLLTLPIGFFLLRQGYPPYVIVLVSFVLECISTVYRVFYFNHLTGYSKLKYCKEILLNSFLCLLPVVLVLVGLNYFFYIYYDSWKYAFLTFFISFSMYGACIYLYGLSKHEKNLFNLILSKILKKIK